MMLMFFIVTFVDIGGLSSNNVDAWSRVVVVEDACVFRNNLSMKFRNGSAADVARIYREHLLEYDDELWRTLFDATAFTSTMIVMPATLRIDGCVASDVLVKRNIQHAMTASHYDASLALELYIASRNDLRREIFIATLLAGHAGIVRSFHCLLNDDVALKQQQSAPLNLVTFSRGNVAHQMLRGLVYDDLNDMLVVEQLPLLSDALSQNRKRRRRDRDRDRKGNDNKNNNNEDDLSNAFDRLSVALSICKLVHWLVSSAPGAPFLICDLLPEVFGLYRDNIDGRLRARLVDFENMHSAQYRSTMKWQQQQLAAESCIGTTNENNCVGCVGSRDAKSALKYQTDRGKCINSKCTAVPVDESTLRY